jgi:hypothetical protein
MKEESRKQNKNKKDTPSGNQITSPAEEEPMALLMALVASWPLVAPVINFLDI